MAHSSCAPYTHRTKTCDTQPYADQELVEPHTHTPFFGPVQLCRLDPVEARGHRFYNRPCTSSHSIHSFDNEVDADEDFYYPDPTTKSIHRPTVFHPWPCNNSSATNIPFINQEPCFGDACKDTVPCEAAQPCPRDSASFLPQSIPYGQPYNDFLSSHYQNSYRSPDTTNCPDGCIDPSHLLQDESQVFCCEKPDCIQAMEDHQEPIRSITAPHFSHGEPMWPNTVNVERQSVPAMFGRPPEDILQAHPGAIIATGPHYTSVAEKEPFFFSPSTEQYEVPLQMSSANRDKSRPASQTDSVRMYRCTHTDGESGKQCTYQTAFRANMCRHMDKHFANRFKCKLCKSGQTKSGNLKRHLLMNCKFGKGNITAEMQAKDDKWYLEFMVEDPKTQERKDLEAKVFGTASTPSSRPVSRSVQEMATERNFRNPDA